MDDDDDICSHSESFGQRIFTPIFPLVISLFGESRREICRGATNSISMKNCSLMQYIKVLVPLAWLIESTHKELAVCSVKRFDKFNLSFGVRGGVSSKC